MVTYEITLDNLVAIAAKQLGIEPSKIKVTSRIEDMFPQLVDALRDATIMLSELPGDHSMELADFRSVLDHAEEGSALVLEVRCELSEANKIDRRIKRLSAPDSAPEPDPQPDGDATPESEE